VESRPDPTPEGKLIADALTRTGLSIREVSRRAGISYGRWRQITSGFQNISPGSYAPVKAPAATLARMAAAVHVTPGKLTEAGREDAAQVLTEILAEAEPAKVNPVSFADPADPVEKWLLNPPADLNVTPEEISALVITHRVVAQRAGVFAEGYDREMRELRRRA